MNTCLSLMACLFGASFDRRFNEEEKRHEKETNVKFYHTHSTNRLTFLFRTGRNESITTSHSCKTIPHFHDCLPKVCILHRDISQHIGHLISNRKKYCVPK